MQGLRRHRSLPVKSQLTTGGRGTAHTASFRATVTDFSDFPVAGREFTTHGHCLVFLPSKCLGDLAGQPSGLGELPSAALIPAQVLPPRTLGGGRPGIQKPSTAAQHQPGVGPSALTVRGRDEPGQVDDPEALRRGVSSVPHARLARTRSRWGKGPFRATDVGLQGSLGMRAAAEDHPMCVFMTAANPSTRGVCSTTCRARPDSTVLLQVGLASSQLSRRQGANTQPVRCLGLLAAKRGACSRIYGTPTSCRPMLLEVLLDTTR